MKTLIAIHAPKGAGKSTARDALCRHLNFNLASLAFSIRNHAGNLGYPTSAHSGEEKETWVHPVLGCTFRQFAQGQGQYFREVYGRDALARILKYRLDNCLLESHRFCVDDVRDIKELDVLREVEGYTTTAIKISRPGVEYTKDHPTEMGIPDSEFDYLINNNKTKEQLAEDVINIVKPLL